LEGKKILAAVNFPPKQIGPVMSEVLVLGTYDENKYVLLALPDKNAVLGSKLL
jgi:tRNA-binding protein